MRALFRITPAFTAVLFGALAAAWVFLFATPPGRTSLKHLAETKIGAATGGEASIGELGGALPGAVTLENIALSDQRGIWLTIDRAELVWRPFLLLQGRIEIDTASIAGARLLLSPPDRPDDEKKPRGFELPDRMPNISIGGLSITDFRVSENLAGNEVRLDAGGSARMGGRILDIALTATSSGDRDYLKASIERQGDNLSTNIIVKSDNDGAIAAITNLGGAVFIEADGVGPLAGYKLDVNASLGLYGAFSGAIFGDFERMETIAFEGKAELGERLSNTSNAVGTSASFKGAFAPHDDGGEIAIARFQSALGVAQGTARWRNRGAALDDVTVKASASLDESWRPDIRPYIGDQISVDGEMRLKGGDYVADAAIEATYFNGILKGVISDLRSFARGPADISLTPNAALPDGLSGGAEVSGSFDLKFGESIAAESLNLKTAQGGTFMGVAAYNFDTRYFAAKGDASAPPALFSSVNAKLAAKRNASGTIGIKGTPENFSGTIVASTPSLLYDKRVFPASRLSIAFADAPAATAGQIALRAADGSLRLNSNFARSARGDLRASGIDYAGADFALKGSATLIADGGGMDVDLAYRGIGAAEPWPGFALAGDFIAKGAIARGDSTNRLTVTAGALSSRNWKVEGLSIDADGPSSRLAVSGTASALSIEGAAPISDLAAVATVIFGRTLRVDLTKLTADLAGAPVKLLQPAHITIGKGVTMDTLRAAVGRSGSISLDGEFTGKRWRAKIASRRAPIVSASSVIDIDIDLDTDRKAPASGAFTISSLLSKTEDANLSGRLNWDGRSFSLSTDEMTEALDLDLSLPARLIRTPRLSISTDGQMSGNARYAGRVETIAGFLPAALQSIEGALSFTGRASGTLAAPKLTGDLTISNGAFTELSSGLSIVNIDATARADAALSGSTIEFKASGSGVRQTEKTISASGTITLGKESRLASRTNFTRAKLSAGPVTEVEASGEIDLSGSFENLIATGDLTVRSLDARVFTPETTGLVDINVVRMTGEGRPAAATNASPLTTITYALRIKGDDRIFVRGRGLESEWRADVNIEGRASAPAILGSMTMKNGEITFAGRRFEMSEGKIAFDRLSINNPSLYLIAERETKSGTQATITIEGRARAPKISLTSTPALPSEDIMALILFDKPASELSAIESLQVAEGLAELGGIGPFGGNGITGSARQALGLDLLNLDINEADSAASSLTIGKYVADGLFISATQDARGENGSVRIEYEIDQSFTVETELRQDGDQTVSANWKRDF